ncbi:Rho GTPase-activating protein 7 [Dissostichus eleginoides]|uniref:Rho GTPase-activating protein 7 n=1 Tax=Dissostichus eleginoides TaxID=100907 RepID=A0AAD9C167_DISEL|nr:Rho GTPase-activating protein 7 [Dissostichus eleginoides]
MEEEKEAYIIGSSGLVFTVPQAVWLRGREEVSESKRAPRPEKRANKEATCNFLHSPCLSPGTFTWLGVGGQGIVRRQRAKEKEEAALRRRPGVSLAYRSFFVFGSLR